MTLASSMAGAAVISHIYAMPIGINTLGLRKPGGFIKGGVTYRIDYVGAPYPLDFDGNGSVDLTISGDGRTSYTSAMFVTQHGRNQVWSYAGGFEGLDFGSHALALVGGSRIGPSLMSPVKAVGWHNDDDLIEPSNLVSAIGNNPSFTRKNLGFRFERDGALHYAWMEISGRYNYSGGDVFIHAWAWESEPGKGILVGAIPEPGVGWLLLLGAWLGLRRGRGAWDVPLKWVG